MDMDLEHIKSLKAGGMDHPSNWVWASADLNRLRGDEDLGPFVDKRAEDEGVTGPSGGTKLGQTAAGKFDAPGKAKQSFQKMFRGQKEKAAEFVDEFGQPGTKNKKWGIFDPDTYSAMSQEEIEKVREKASQHYGMSDEQAAYFFPDKADLTGTPYVEDPERYDRESTENMRTQVAYRQALEKVGARYKKEIQDAIKYGTQPTSKVVKNAVAAAVKKQEKPPKRRHELTSSKYLKLDRDEKLL